MPAARAEVVAHVVAPSEADDPALRARLLRTWVDASEAGGSVGFVPPVDPAAVGRALDALLERVRAGTDALVVLRTAGGEEVAMAVLVAGTSGLTAHWRTVARLVVHPEHQGRGAGRTLLDGVHAHARALGLEQLALTVRDGEGLEPFYARAGYVVVGRHPGALRVRPGDDRDEVRMAVRL